MIENNNDEVLILGLPNSGKSTLVNALTSKKVSIIGSTPNTTRDKVTTNTVINNKQVVISYKTRFGNIHLTLRHIQSKHMFID